jgi:hypothetical protein
MPAPIIHYRLEACQPFNACNGRLNDGLRLTTDRAAVTCKRCAAKYPATVRCPTCGRTVAHDALQSCVDDLTRCEGEGGCLERWAAREPSLTGRKASEPNLQNVPVRTALGRQVRTALGRQVREHVALSRSLQAPATVPGGDAIPGVCESSVDGIGEPADLRAAGACTGCDGTGASPTNPAGLRWASCERCDGTGKEPAVDPLAQAWKPAAPPKPARSTPQPVRLECSGLRWLAFDAESGARFFGEWGSRAEAIQAMADRFGAVKVIEEPAPDADLRSVLNLLIEVERKLSAAPEVVAFWGEHLRRVDFPLAALDKVREAIKVVDRTVNG